MLAEQCVNTRPQIKVLKGGERVIVDHDLTISRAYLYFYLVLNIGAIIGETGKLNFSLEAHYG
jgi:POT family proton-dependent oligopeptide transporter